MPHLHPAIHSDEDLMAAAEAAHEAEYDADTATRKAHLANLRYASMLARRFHPDTAALVIATSQDASWNCYAHALLDADHQVLATHDDLFSERDLAKAWLGAAIQQTVMSLPTGACDAASSTPWRPDPADASDIEDPYVVEFARFTH